MKHVMVVAIAAILGGIVAAGSSRSTARKAADELTALEAKRAALIGQLELRIMPDPPRSSMLRGTR